MQKPLDFASGPLVWIDCEMTGLNPRKDKIIEIAVLITNGDLELVDEGIEYVIRTEKKYLDGMDEWCTNQHRSVNGGCISERDVTDRGFLVWLDRSMPELSAYQRIRYLLLGKLRTPPEPDYILPVTQEVLKYIQKWIPNHRTGVLAGSSVHADRSFLVEEMPTVTDWLHYRIVDVSSIKELVRRWYPDVRIPKDALWKGDHRYSLPPPAQIMCTDDSVEVL
ncbi:hypothetical protein HWV62_29537 [Athelia sp. TMB]|nr:hypothetical protein HWV62_29537 [Athelia sp. TMB]